MTQGRAASFEALLRLGSITDLPWDALLQQVLLVTSDVLGIARVSFWRFRSEPASIVCELGFDVRGQRFERGLVLRRQDALPYLDALERQRVLPIGDAASDPLANCLREYLDQRGIGALLDGVVRLNGVPMGLVCAENVGGPRAWSSQEQEFLFAVTQILSTRLAVGAHSIAEQGRQRATLLSDLTATLAELLDPRSVAEVAVRRSLRVAADMAVVATFDPERANELALAYLDPSQGPLLQELLRRYPPALDAPGLVGQAMRRAESVLVPFFSADTAEHYGVDAGQLELVDHLRITSAIVVPFTVRGQMTGALVFARTSAQYTQDDLWFAERYAQAVSVHIENARLYRQAREAVRVRDEFLMLASHELRTPLTSLRLLAERLCKAALTMPAGAVSNACERILRLTTRLETLAGRLLDACEIGTGGSSIRPARIDLRQLALDVVKAYSDLADRVGSELELVAEGPIEGNWDPVRLEEALGNLIENAIKFGAGHPIRVELGTEDGVATLSVSDQGPGISSTDQEHVFERYRRGASATGQGGLGLGLYIVKAIVEAHHGSVRIESQPGSGSTFVLELPTDEHFSNGQSPDVSSTP